MELTLLPIEPSHDESVCNIIKAVGAEFGAVGEGFGPSDPEVEAMSAHYTKENKKQIYRRVDGRQSGWWVWHCAL